MLFFTPSQIAKTLRSMSIRHSSTTKYIIDENSLPVGYDSVLLVTRIYTKHLRRRLMPYFSAEWFHWSYNLDPLDFQDSPEFSVVYTGMFFTMKHTYIHFCQSLPVAIKCNILLFIYVVDRTYIFEEMCRKKLKRHRSDACSLNEQYYEKHLKPNE